jgi:hypothetical protein
LKTQELTKTEVDQIQLRVDLANQKKNEVNKLSIEHQIIAENINQYLQSLLKKYDLDNNRQWRFNGSGLQEVDDSKDKPVNNEIVKED